MPWSWARRVCASWPRKPIEEEHFIDYYPSLQRVIVNTFSFFLFFFFFVVSIRQKRFHALANFLSQVNRSIINDEKAWMKIETVSIVSGSYIINLSIKLNRLTNSISWTVIEKEGRSLGRKSFLHKLPSWCIILANLVVSRLSFE